MGAIQRHGLKNNLIQWVHRHDRMATLFRSVSSANSPHLPFIPSASPVQPGSQDVPNHELSIESDIAIPGVHRQDQATHAPVAFPTRVVPSTNETPSQKPLTPRSTESPKTSEHQ